MADKRISRINVVGQAGIGDIDLVKQYLLFTYYVGRPLGGMKDFLDSFETVEDALDNILDEWTRYYQVVDRDTLEVVKEGLARFKNYTPESFNRDNDSISDDTK